MLDMFKKKDKRKDRIGRNTRSIRQPVSDLSILGIKNLWLNSGNIIIICHTKNVILL